MTLEEKQAVEDYKELLKDMSYVNDKIFELNQNQVVSNSELNGELDVLVERIEKLRNDYPEAIEQYCDELF